MKIQLDTDNKTIKLENDILLSKLVETLNKLLPNGEWKKFTLQTNTVINHWNSPIVIEKYVQPWRPYNPWQPWYHSITSGLNANQMTAEYKANNTSLELKSGVYNVEL